MVTTRHHPREFPEPATPTSRSPSSTAAPATPPSRASPNAVTKSPSKSPTKRQSAPTGSAAPSTRTPAGSGSGYVHSPDPWIVGWLLVSLVLVLWDMLYVFLRPYTMPGGVFHSPLWTPYALYGTVDYLYGWPAWNNNVGFTAAQSFLNLIESCGYVWYLVMCEVYGGTAFREFWKRDVRVQGRNVGLGVVVCFSAAVMTVSKTVLYWLNELFSGFENIGHNSLGRLVFLWIIPNGAWIIIPSYIIYVLGQEIVESLNSASPKQKTS